MNNSPWKNNLSARGLHEIWNTNAKLSFAGIRKLDSTTICVIYDLPNIEHENKTSLDSDEKRVFFSKCLFFSTIWIPLVATFVLSRRAICRVLPCVSNGCYSINAAGWVINFQWSTNQTFGWKFSIIAIRFFFQMKFLESNNYQYLQQISNHCFSFFCFFNLNFYVNCGCLKYNVSNKIVIFEIICVAK